MMSPQDSAPEPSPQEAFSHEAPLPLPPLGLPPIDPLAAREPANRPSAPRLGIAHMLVFTACSAAYLAVQRIWLLEADPRLGSFELINLAAYAAAVGPALATIVLWPAWRVRGYAFPRHSGEWLLLLSGCVAVLGTARSIADFVTSFPWPVELAASLAYLALAIGTYALAFRRGNRRPAWRSLFFVWGTTIFFRDVSFTRFFWTFPFDLLPVTSFVLLGFLGLSAIGDLRRRLPWTHWLGVFVLAADEGTNAAWWLWYSYFRPATP